MQAAMPVYSLLAINVSASSELQRIQCSKINHATWQTDFSNDHPKLGINQLGVEASDNLEIE